MAIALTRTTGKEGTSTANANRHEARTTGPDSLLLPCLHVWEPPLAPSVSCSRAWRSAWPSEEDSSDCGETNHIAGVRGTLGQQGVFRVFSGRSLNRSLGSFQNGLDP